MKERAGYKLPVDEEVAELALSALGWKEPQQTGAQDMLSIAIEPQTFSSRHSARRSAKRALAKPDAREGIDFDIDETEKGVTVVMKMPEKVAAGPTGIERQYGKVAPTTPNKAREILTTAIAASNARTGATPIVEMAPKKKPKPAKKPTRKGATRPPKKTTKAAAPTMNGKTLPNGPSKVQIVADLICSEKGATAADCLAATGWKQISISAAFAKRGGFALRKEKDGKTTRYFGTR